jgi:hypothetical protein
MMPSPQLGVHKPCELATNPEAEQVMHELVDLHVLQVGLQA